MDEKQVRGWLAERVSLSLVAITVLSAGRMLLEMMVLWEIGLGRRDL